MEKKYPHPGFEVDRLTMLLWELRNQLEINNHNIRFALPVDDLTMKMFGHPIDMANMHVHDKLDELEAYLRGIAR